MKLEQLKKTILSLDKKKRIKFIYLFGSVTKHTNTPLSDLDLAVYFKGSEKERFKFRMKVLGELPDKVDLQIFQDLPLPVKKEVITGKVLYYQDFQFIFDESMKVIKEFNSFEKYYNHYLSNMAEGVKV